MNKVSNRLRFFSFHLIRIFHIFYLQTFLLFFMRSNLCEICRSHNNSTSLSFLTSLFAMVSISLLTFNKNLHSVLSLHFCTCVTWPFLNKLSNTPGRFGIWKKQYFFPYWTITRHSLEKALACSSIYSYFIKRSGGGARLGGWKNTQRWLIWGVQRCGDHKQMLRHSEGRFSSLLFDALCRSFNSK